MTDIYKAAALALEADGCERLKDFYNVGPVQRAAVESFVLALEASHHKPAPPELVAEVDAALGLQPKGDHFPDATKMVPLTDEQIDRMTDAQWASNNHKPIYAAHRAYARAIERAHGIGGQQ